MIRPNFLTTADRLELLSCVKRQREDHGVGRRANALLLLDTGMSCSQIAKVLFLDEDTVRSWHKQYLAEDWEASPTMDRKAGSHVTYNRHYPTQKHLANAKTLGQRKNTWPTQKHLANAKTLRQRKNTSTTQKHFDNAKTLRQRKNTSTTQF